MEKISEIALFQQSETYALVVETPVSYTHLMRLEDGFSNSSFTNPKYVWYLYLCSNTPESICSIPVSYTHLDVYKRQEELSGIMGLISTYRKSGYKSPVSYTHLQIIPECSKCERDIHSNTQTWHRWHTYTWHWRETGTSHSESNIC